MAAERRPWDPDGYLRSPDVLRQRRERWDREQCADKPWLRPPDREFLTFSSPLRRGSMPWPQFREALGLSPPAPSATLAEADPALERLLFSPDGSPRSGAEEEEEEEEEEAPWASPSPRGAASPRSSPVPRLRLGPSSAPPTKLIDFRELAPKRPLSASALGRPQQPRPRVRPRSAPRREPAAAPPLGRRCRVCIQPSPCGRLAADDGAPKALRLFEKDCLEALQWHVMSSLLRARASASSSTAALVLEAPQPQQPAADHLLDLIDLEGGTLMFLRPASEAKGSRLPQEWRLEVLQPPDQWAPVTTAAEAWAASGSGSGSIEVRVRVAPPAVPVRAAHSPPMSPATRLRQSVGAPAAPVPPPFTQPDPAHPPEPQGEEEEDLDRMRRELHRKFREVRRAKRERDRRKPKEPPAAAAAAASRPRTAGPSSRPASGLLSTRKAAVGSLIAAKGRATQTVCGTPAAPSGIGRAIERAYLRRAAQRRPRKR